MTPEQLLKENSAYRAKCLKRLTAVALELGIGESKVKQVLFGKTLFEMLWMTLVAHMGTKEAINTLCMTISNYAAHSDDLEEMISEIKRNAGL